MNRVRCSILSLFILVLVPACEPIGKNPLSDPEKAKLDKRILGLWVGKTESDSLCYLHAVGAGKNVDLVAIIHNEGSGAELLQLKVFPTKIKGHCYMNIRFVDATGEPNGRYIFAQYDIVDSNNELRIRPLRREPIVQAIKKGDLKGEVSKLGRSVQIDAESDDLATFFMKSDHNTLFGKPCAMRRVITEKKQP